MLYISVKFFFVVKVIETATQDIVLGVIALVVICVAASGTAWHGAHSDVFVQEFIIWEIVDEVTGIDWLTIAVSIYTMLCLLFGNNGGQLLIDDAINPLELLE